MADEWIDCKLEDLIDIKHGFAFQGEYFRDEPPGDMLLTPGNFAIGGGFKSDKYKFYNGPVPEEFILAKGDLLVTMTDLSKAADTLGFPAFVPQPLSTCKYLHNQRLGKVVIKPSAPITQKFLYYLFCTREYRNEVLSSATGTTVKHTSPSRIKQFKFKLPPISIQQAIAHILYTLDNKIELNRRMNETLEAMARILFKSWFVDFDPVRDKAAGRGTNFPKHIAELFPDTLVDSELGKIPEGWGTGVFGEVANNSRLGIRAEDIVDGTPYFGLEHMPRRCIALAEWGQSDELESNKHVFEQGDILFGKLRPYFHKVGVAPVTGICSTDILVIKPKSPEWFGFVLGHASSKELVNYTDAASTGTKMPRTNWNDISKYQIALPDKRIAKAYNQIVQPAVDRMVNAIHESRTLASLRDTLLPKLISGEIGVQNLTLLMKEEV